MHLELLMNAIDAMKIRIDHFTVVCLVTWPVNESEAGVDLALIETFSDVNSHLLA